MPNFNRLDYRQIMDLIDLKARSEKISEIGHATGFALRCDLGEIPDPDTFAITADARRKRTFICRFEWVIQGSAVVVEISIGSLLTSYIVNYAFHYGSSATAMNVFDQGTFPYEDEQAFEKFRQQVVKLQEVREVSSDKVPKEDLYQKIRDVVDKWQAKDFCSYAALLKAKMLIAAVHQEWSFNSLLNSNKVFHIEHVGSWQDAESGIMMEWRNKETGAYMKVVAQNDGAYSLSRAVGGKQSSLVDKEPISTLVHFLKKVY